MKKQKICVIGGGITGLTVATTLARPNLHVDLIDENFYKNFNTIRTTAISDSNYTFLKKLNISNYFDQLSWPCKEMKLYDVDKNSKNIPILNFDRENKKNNILYMMTNEKLSKALKQKIKENQNIAIKSNIYVSELFSADGLKYIKTFDQKILKYNLIIVCTGRNSFLTKKLLEGRYFNNDYNEISLTLTMMHKSVKNNIARQFFLKEGPLAFLPISNSKTSVIWSIRKNIFYSQKNNKKIFLIKKLKKLSKEIYKNIKISSKIERYNLNSHLGDKCFKERVLVFGDALYSVHPLTGQGFNMILRDLQKLSKIIRRNIALGLDIGSSIVLSEFANDTKSNNFVYSTGIETIKKIFTTNNVIIKNLRNYCTLQLNKNRNAKNFFINLADKGINL